MVVYLKLMAQNNQISFTMLLNFYQDTRTGRLERQSDREEEEMQLVVSLTKEHLNCKYYNII